MSRQEQAALVAFFNSFKLSKRVTTFDQLADGKVMMEIMSVVDPTHFKSTASQGSSGPAVSASAENWVYRMNTLKRLHRLLTTYSLPPPHPASLSLSTLPEPNLTSIARAPNSLEGKTGLMNMIRMCLTVGACGPGNEKVIRRIQGLGEDHMAELMQSIEEIMSTLPQGAAESRRSPVNEASPTFPSAKGVIAERDRLLHENDELRSRCEQVMEQIAELTSNLEETRLERDEALESALKRLDSSTAGLRRSQTVSGNVDELRTDLGKAEDALARAELDLQEKSNRISELTRTVEQLRTETADIPKLKDQLDEHRHAADRLRKSENVIEKYKKKLEDSVGLRRELRTLEEENAALINSNAIFEADRKQARASNSTNDTYRSRIQILERTSAEQAAQIAELELQLEASRAELSDLERSYDQDREEMQLHHDRAKELELGAPGLKRAGSQGTSFDGVGDISLHDELGDLEDVSSPMETKTSLKIRLRTVQRELADARSSSGGDTPVARLEVLLKDANKAKDRYQGDYLEAYRNNLRLQANLERIRSGRGGNIAHIDAALRLRLDEVLEERDDLLRAKQETELARESIEKELQMARTDLSLVGRDQRHQLSVLREKIASETRGLEAQVAGLKDQIAALQEKNKDHLNEIQNLLMEKIDLQSAGLDQRERAIEREKEFSDIRASMAATGVPPEAQKHMLDIHERNTLLGLEVQTLEAKLEKAKMFIQTQDAMFRAESGQREDTDSFGEAHKSYESQIEVLQKDLRKAKSDVTAVERRYKLEQQLMLSAWHDLGTRVVRDHLNTASARRSGAKPIATSWLGRQRRHQEDASFTRL